MKSISLFVGAATIALLSLVACNKNADGTAPAGSGTTTSAGGKKAKTSLTFKAYQDAYKAEFDAPGKMTAPMDKKVEAFSAKMGKPDSDTGRKRTWYALDGSKCKKIELDTKDGSASETDTAAGDCGM